MRNYTISLRSMGIIAAFGGYDTIFAQRLAVPAAAGPATAF